jgi:NOL1/NOP2/fmu family ribosome biogenesis protein
LAASKEHGRFLRIKDSEEINYEPLSRRADLDFRERLVKTYGCTIPDNFQFYTLGKDSVYLVPGEVAKFDTQDFRVEIKGLYFSHYDQEYLRLSPEGAQIVEKTAVKNVLDITNEEAEKMIRGYDLEKENSLDASFVILRCPKGVIGVGKNHKTRVLCQISKSRRVHQI